MTKNSIQTLKNGATLYIDFIGNEAEEVKFETIIIKDDTQRTWLRKHKTFTKGCTQFKDESFYEVLKENDAKHLWESCFV